MQMFAVLKFRVSVTELIVYNRSLIECKWIMLAAHMHAEYNKRAFGIMFK